MRMTHHDVGTSARAAQRALGDGDVIARQIELGVPRFGEENLCWIRDRNVSTMDVEDFVFTHAFLSPRLMVCWLQIASLTMSRA